MNKRRFTIENLEQELQRLSIAADSVRETIRVLQQESELTSRSSTVTTDSLVPGTSSSSPPTPDITTDRDGTPIVIGSRIRFLTKGR